MATDGIDKETIRKKGAQALCADLQTIVEELHDKDNLPVETRQTLHDPYLRLMKAGYELTGADITWVPPTEDPSSGEMANSIANLREYILAEGKLPSATTEDIKTFRDVIVDFVHKLEEATSLDYAFKEEDTQKKYGRWVQSLGVRDDVDPDEIDGGNGREIFAGPRARIELERLPREARDCNNYDVPLFLGTGVRKGKDATLEKNTLYRHTAVLGVTGYGKSTLITNNQKQLIESGQGICFIDPKGDDSERLVEILPDDRKDDLIWIEPGSTSDKISGFNFINVGLPADHPQIDTAVSALVEDLKKMLGAGEYWGPRMDRIAGNLIRAMNVYNRNNPTRPDLNLADLYYVLQDARSRREFEILVKAEGIDFIEDYTQKIAEMQEDNLEPILGRMQPWIESPIARRMICFRDSPINIPEAVQEGKIIVVRMGSQPKDLKRMLGMAVIRRIWATIRSRADMATHDRDPFYLFVDEAHNIALADETFPTMLAEARSYRLSINLATQYLSALPQNVVRAMRVNCDTIMTFNPGSIEEARKVAPQMDIDPQPLLNESRFHIWMRMTDPEAGELTDPFKVYAHPPFPPYRTADEAQDVIEESLERVGREKITPEQRKENLQFYQGKGQLETGVGKELIALEQDGDIPPEVIEGKKNEAIANRRKMLHSPDGMDANTDESEVEEKDKDELDKTDRKILESIYAARVKADLKPQAVVLFEDVEAEIEARLEDSRSSESIANSIEALSQFVSLTTKQGEDAVRLKNEGRSVVFGQTGESITGGDIAHRRVLRQSFKLFTWLGYHVSLPIQESDELPDGVAETPFDPGDIDTTNKPVTQLQEELEERQQHLEEQYPSIAALSDGETLRIEAETSTHRRPSHTLQNLRKSINRGEKTVFATKGGYFDDDVPDNSENPTAHWGPFIERIFYDQEYDPTKGAGDKNGRNVAKHGEENLILARERDDRGNIVFYNKDDHYEVTVSGEERKALRPASDGRGTTWRELSDGSVVAEYNAPPDEYEDNPVFARFDNQEHAGQGDPTAVPAYYYYNRADDNFIVVDGGEEYTYQSKEELEEDWETFCSAFLPETELDRIPTEDDFFVIVLPQADNPEYEQPLYVEQGEVTLLSEILDVDVPSRAYRTDIAEAETKESESVDEQQSEDEPGSGKATDNKQGSEAEPETEMGEATPTNGEANSDSEPESQGKHNEQRAASQDETTQYTFPEVVSEAPSNCPQCETPLEQKFMPFAGDATDLDNFPAALPHLTQQSLVDIDAKPPVVPEMIEVMQVACSDCQFNAKLHLSDVESDEQQDETESKSDSEPDNDTENQNNKKSETADIDNKQEQSADAEVTETNTGNNDDDGSDEEEPDFLRF